MIDLFNHYSLSEIITFVALLAIAVKEVITFVDFIMGKIRKVSDNNYEERIKEEDIDQKINELNKFFDEKEKVDNQFDKINNVFDNINKRIDMLVESDKEDIKSYITEKHHYFVYQQGWIDDYSLECLEKRFAIYQRENGNSFVEGLMEELRNLRKQPPDDDRYKYDGTAKFVTNANNK